MLSEKRRRSQEGSGSSCGSLARELWEAFAGIDRVLTCLAVSNKGGKLFVLSEHLEEPAFQACVKKRAMLPSVMVAGGSLSMEAVLHVVEAGGVLLGARLAGKGSAEVAVATRDGSATYVFSFPPPDLRSYLFFRLNSWCVAELLKLLRERGERLKELLDEVAVFKAVREKAEALGSLSAMKVWRPPPLPLLVSAETVIRYDVLGGRIGALKYRAERVGLGAGSSPYEPSPTYAVWVDGEKHTFLAEENLVHEVAQQGLLSELERIVRQLKKLRKAVEEATVLVPAFQRLRAQ